MSDRINSTTLQQVFSVNTPDFPTPPWYEPDLSQVTGVLKKYWKWDAVNLRPVEMSAGEKTTTDAALLAAYEAGRVSSFDAQAPLGIDRCIIKPSDTVRTATTTLANDPDLLFPVVAGGKYMFALRVFFDTTAAGDFKIALSGPTSPTGLRFATRAVAPGATAFTAIGVQTAYGTGAAIAGTGTTGGYAMGEGILYNGANAGNVSLQWAQNTSDPGNTTVRTGSTMRWTRIG